MTRVRALETHSAASGFSGPEPSYVNLSPLFLLTQYTAHPILSGSRWFRVPWPGSVETFPSQPNQHSTSPAHTLSLDSPVSNKPPPTAWVPNFLHFRQLCKFILLASGRWRQLSPGGWGHLGQHRKPFVSTNNFIFSWLTYYFLVGDLISSPKLKLLASVSSTLISAHLSWALSCR